MFQWICFPRNKSSQLLPFRNGEKIFKQNDAVFDQHLLKQGDIL